MNLELSVLSSKVECFLWPLTSAFSWILYLWKYLSLTVKFRQEFETLTLKYVYLSWMNFLWSSQTIWALTVQGPLGLIAVEYLISTGIQATHCLTEFPPQYPLDLSSVNYIGFKAREEDLLVHLGISALRLIQKRDANAIESSLERVGPHCQKQ